MNGPSFHRHEFDVAAPHFERRMPRDSITVRRRGYSHGAAAGYRQPVLAHFNAPLAW